MIKWDIRFFLLFFHFNKYDRKKVLFLTENKLNLPVMLDSF